MWSGRGGAIGVPKRRFRFICDTFRVSSSCSFMNFVYNICSWRQFLKPSEADAGWTSPGDTTTSMATPWITSAARSTPDSTSPTCKQTFHQIWNSLPECKTFGKFSGCPQPCRVCGLAFPARHQLSCSDSWLELRLLPNRLERCWGTRRSEQAKKS